MGDGPGHFAVARCWSCRRLFTFNPHLVPSIPIDPDTGEPVEGGTREPICRLCATAANMRRRRAGLPLWDTSDAAYGPVEGLPE